MTTPLSLRTSTATEASIGAVLALCFALFTGCAGSSSESAAKLVTLNVTDRLLTATIERDAARVTYEAERGEPFDPATMENRDPKHTPPGPGATLLKDRNGHVITVTGDSFAQPGSWRKLLETTPTRTNEQLDADLEVARQLPDLLAKDERVQKWFRWEVALLRTELAGMAPYTK